MSNEAKTLLGIGIVTTVLLLGAVFLLSKSSTQTAPSPQASLSPELLVRADSPQTASQSAKVNIVEFGDFQCPACAQAEPVLKQALTAYSGKINLVFRHFPLSIHPNAQIAAEAAEAAGEQGKFWEMDELLYKNQAEWAQSNDPLSSFKTYARLLGLDVNKFAEAVSANKFAGKIKRDQEDGNSLGIRATPTFFINGQKIEGVPTYPALKGIIDSVPK